MHETVLSTCFSYNVTFPQLKYYQVIKRKVAATDHSVPPVQYVWRIVRASNLPIVVRTLTLDSICITARYSLSSYIKHVFTYKVYVGNGEAEGQLPRLYTIDIRHLCHYHFNLQHGFGH